MMAWRTAALDIDGLPPITVHELKRRLADGQVDLLDVRQLGEWAHGHVAGATFITGGGLPRRLCDVPRTGRPLAVACGSGYRSSVAASLVAPEPTSRSSNVLGGAWNAAAYPTTKET